MIDLSIYPLDWLVDEKISLLQRVAAAKAPVIYPPPGYRFDYAKLKHLEDRLAEVNKELAIRRDAKARAEVTPETWQVQREANLRGMQQFLDQTKN